MLLNVLQKEGFHGCQGYHVNHLLGQSISIPCSGPWLPQGLFQTARCSAIKSTATTQCCFPHIFAWHELGPGPSPGKADKSTELSSNFKMLWDSSAKQIEREHRRNYYRGQVPNHSTVQGVLCKAEPTVLGLLNVCPFFYILCLILLVKDTISFQH